VDRFPEFNEAIECYVRTERLRETMDGDFELIPGLRFLPWDIFGFIDCSNYQSCTPFSGPRGDYEGAARQAEFPDGQRAFYSGYTGYHGTKLLTMLTPDGISYLFGPVSVRPNDIAVLQLFVSSPARVLSNIYS
jgi:hypothetical protein